VETVPWLPYIWRGIEGVFFSAGKQHDTLKKKTMDKTLENTLKASINTKLPTCDDKGVFTDDDVTYRKLFVTLVTEVSLISREPNLRFERISISRGIL
jgi:hypothetical protein